MKTFPLGLKGISGLAICSLCLNKACTSATGQGTESLHPAGPETPEVPQSYYVSRLLSNRNGQWHSFLAPAAVNFKNGNRLVLELSHYPSEISSPACGAVDCKFQLLQTAPARSSLCLSQGLLRWTWLWLSVIIFFYKHTKPKPQISLLKTQAFLPDEEFRVDTRLSVGWVWVPKQNI